jgi:hypothetical protein
MTERLIEAVISAFRARTPRGDIQDSPSWWDLTESQRVEAFDLTLQQRAIEAALHPLGHTQTTRLLLDRIRG